MAKHSQSDQKWPNSSGSGLKMGNSGQNWQKKLVRRQMGAKVPPFFLLSLLFLFQCFAPGQDIFLACFRPIFQNKSVQMHHLGIFLSPIFPQGVRIVVVVLRRSGRRVSPPSDKGVGLGSPGKQKIFELTRLDTRPGKLKPAKGKLQKKAVISARKTLSCAARCWPISDQSALPNSKNSNPKKNASKLQKK